MPLRDPQHSQPSFLEPVRFYLRGMTKLTRPDLLLDPPLHRLRLPLNPPHLRLADPRRSGWRCLLLPLSHFLQIELYVSQPGLEAPGRRSSRPDNSGIKHLAQLSRQLLDTEWLGEKVCARVDDAVVNHGVAGIAGGEDHL